MQKAKASEDVARYSGWLGAYISYRGNPRIGGVFGAISIFSTLNAHALYAEGGQFNEAVFLSDMYTTMTSAFRNPLFEEFYDESIGFMVNEASKE